MIIHPSLDLLCPDFSRDDLFLVVYCMVDDWMKMRFGSSNMPRSHRGPGPDDFTDSDAMTVLLVGELCHCLRERAWLRQMRANHLSLFKNLPEDSRFSRSAQMVRTLLTAMRRAILCWADVDIQPIRILDGFPMPLCACYRIRQSTLPISGGGFGRNSSKKIWFYGLHPTVLMTASGFIDDIFLAPGWCRDVPTLAGYIDGCVETGRGVTGQTRVMDKGYVGKPIADWARKNLGLNLLARQRDKPGEEPSYCQTMIDKVRKPIEGVISVMTECFGIEHVLARTDWGVFRRVQAKATAFTWQGISIWR